VKGKGYGVLAEKIKPNGNAPGLFDKRIGEIYKKKYDGFSRGKITGCISQQWLLAEKNEKIFGITPAQWIIP